MIQLAHRGQRRRIRSIFISDVHLGCKFAHAGKLLEFLHAYQPEYLYIVGDFIDGWKLRKKWRWRPEYNGILRRIIDLAQSGTCIRYAPGNHDAFLREFLDNFGVVDVADEFVHHTADERRFLVTHGDQFDNIELRAQWLSVIGSVGYDALIWSNRTINRLRGYFRLRPWCYSKAVKARVKSAVRFISDFEKRLAEHATQRGCHGVICGHIHTPVISAHQGVVYCNTGDWVENCSALMESPNGGMEIVNLLPGANDESSILPPSVRDIGPLNRLEQAAYFHDSTL